MFYICRVFLQVTGHLLAVSSYRGLLSVSFYLGSLAVSFHSSLLAVSFYLLVRAVVTCDLEKTPASSAMKKGKDKSQTGSTRIADLNKTSSSSRTRKYTIVLFLFKSTTRVESGPTFVPAQ